MFTNLLASAPKRRVAVSSPAWAISAVAHALVVALILWETSRPDPAPASVAVREWVAYVEIQEEQAPPEEQPEERPEPAPEPEAAAPAVEVTRPDLPAGYQVLTVPDEVVGIPAPGLVEIRAEDFSGQGVLGGVAGGQPLLPLSTTPAADSVAESAPLSVAVVDEPPQLRNRAELAPRMEELYPPGMRMAAIDGEVVVWFVVDTKGRVETDGLRIVSASNPGFEAPTRALVRLMRFEPARRNGKAVRVWVELPLRWASAR